MKIKNFKDLKIWKLGKEIVMDVYSTTAGFPRQENYGLVSQLKRAAVSIPSNIAEGFNRERNKDYRRFLFIALGSSAELETQVEIAFDLGYLPELEKANIAEKIDHENRMLWSMIKRLETLQD